MRLWVFLAALLLRVAHGARVYYSTPYTLGYGGGMILTIKGSGFSEDQFNQFDPTLGNVVKLVNEGDSIDCEVIRYLTNINQIICNTGPKTNRAASEYYTIKVFVDGQEVQSNRRVKYNKWVSPYIRQLYPTWSLPGALVKVTGNIQTNRYKILDVDDPLRENPDSGRVLTKVYLGYVDCEMINSTTGEFYGPFSYSQLTCLSTSKNVGPMNITLYVTQRGSSVNEKVGLQVDSQDKLYQHHTYPGMESVSPQTGSPAGRTLITVRGIGFNPYPGTTHVLVGGAECEIQTITDTAINCLTPPEDQTFPGSSERGLRWEFWEGEYPDLSDDQQWSALNSSHPDYSVSYLLDAHVNAVMSSPSAGKLSGYLHGAHDGHYSLTISINNYLTRIYVATTGDPADLIHKNFGEMFYMRQDTPAYFEIRFRYTRSITFNVGMDDYSAKYTAGQIRYATNERNRVTLNPDEKWDTQRFKIYGTSATAALYLGGFTSNSVNLTDLNKVRSAIISLVEQQCEIVSSDAKFFQYSGYEPNDTLPTGTRGSVVDDIEPYCGRRSLHVYDADPKLYYQNSRYEMVDVHQYPYMCFAFKGNAQSSMKVQFHWRDKNDRWRTDTVSFDHNFSYSISKWSYNCINLMEVALNSRLNNLRNPDGSLRIRIAYAPYRLERTGTVYVDEFTFSDENIDVVRTRPSALKSQGILISDVYVNLVEKGNVTSYDAVFKSSNCFGDFPLLGVADGPANSSWFTELDSTATSASFDVGDVVVNVTRVVTASHPVEGTWSMKIENNGISGISPRVEAHELKEMIELAIGKGGMSVSRSGNCEKYRWDIEWTEDPGWKPPTTVSDAGLSFNGSLQLSAERTAYGRNYHSPIFGDFLTVRRSEPHVSVRVNGYSAARLGDCSFAYDASNVPTLTSVSGSTARVSSDYTISVTGNGFSNSNTNDYTVTIGSFNCIVNAVSSSEITCSVAQLTAGRHSVSVVMQPIGAALQPDPPLTYEVYPVITSVIPSSGGTGGGYLVVVGGSGFPADLPGWNGNTVALGDSNCEVIAADAESVTCTASAGPNGPTNVVLTVNGVTSTLVDGFTYDSALSAKIDSVSPTSSSVLGGDVLTISGSGFDSGSDSNYVKVGSNYCDVLTWTDSTITCTLPSNMPGEYSILVFISGKGFASGSATVTYTLRVTGSSSNTGSVYGGTILVLGGEGFSSNCSLLKVELGDDMVCDVTECSDSEITCTTRLLSINHVITNAGSHGNSGPGYAWTPKYLEVREGDSVTWKWSKIDPFSELSYNVYQTNSAIDKDHNGWGFTSGSPTSTGFMTTTFQNAGTFYYASSPILGSIVMSGSVAVMKPSEKARRIRVMLGDVEAHRDLTGSEPSLSVEGCSSILSTPFDNCNSTAPSVPDSEELYFVTDLCFTPVVTAISPSATESIPGLGGLQVRSGVSLTISGTGFGTEICQTSVRIGPSSCSVSASSDTSISCILDDISDMISLQAFPVVVTIGNRGSAGVIVSDYQNEGRIIVVPVVTALSPVEGSLAGGSLLNISGSGLKAFDSHAQVLLGTGSCGIENVTPTAITCSTTATPESNVTVSVYISAFNVPVINDLPNLKFSFTAAATPSVTNITLLGETFTITGSSLGTDASLVSVTLSSWSETRRSAEKNLPFKPKEKEPFEEMYENLHDSNFFEKFDSESNFWGDFTNTKAKTFEESIKLGAWRMAGSNLRNRLNPENVEMQFTLRQAEPSTYDCVPSSVSDTSIVCEVPGILASSYIFTVNVAGQGNAVLANDSEVFVVFPTINSINPTEGSVNGGALLTISGGGFTPGDVSVTLDDINCPLENAATDSLSCRVPPHVAGSVKVKVTSHSLTVVSSVDFTYAIEKSPVLASVTPNTGLTPDTTLALDGTGLKLSGTNPTVTVGGVDCPVSAATNTAVSCVSPDIAGGPHAVIVRDPLYGASNSDITVSYDFSISSITPSQGGFGGISVTISGSGFSPDGLSTVTVCGNPCSVSSGSSSSISCDVPPYIGSESSVLCDVTVTNPSTSSVTLMDGFTYVESLTPQVTSVSPNRGGTAGGTILTITGTGFALSGNSVTIGGSPCIISSESPSEIVCVTEAHAGSGTFPVLVEVPGKGYAVTDENGEFYYIDRWSSVYTWGGEPVPSEGQLVVVDEGQTVLLDESTDVLKALIIKGGNLVFDKEASEEIVLRAEYILIVDGGSLNIGSEEDPFLNKATIELHGNTRSTELPYYGSKVLAVRNGTLDLHGAPVPVTWTHLAITADPGDTSITLTLPVNWKVGDQIIIASTENKLVVNENEEGTVASVSEDGLTLTLSEPLKFKHISIEQTLGGRVIETRAEVGLLTRNVKIQGNINEDFSVIIEACNETFNAGQFSTQSCFNGRYGKELGSDMFGAVVMLFGKYPDQDLVKGRIEYVEVTEAGQAFQLGRYPLHFHMVGDVSTSYIRGCSVHRTYNRAVTIHGANYLNVTRNVLYNNMGHAIFTEDGVEIRNVIEYNLAVFTRSSSSLLNVDITPASFWLVNPNNIVRHNAAAGGTHFGYWYRLDHHPTGPSATNSICQNNAEMGEFYNNTAHSMGRYGLWVFSMAGYFPKDSGCYGNALVARWNDFTVWRCSRGAEIVFGGSLQFHNFVALDNELAGIEMVSVKGGFGEDDGPGVFNSLLVGHSALSSGQCSGSGIVAPKKEIFNIANVTFVNYDTGSCTALSGCSQCKPRQGGFRTQVKGLKFDNSPNKLRFKWEHETIWIDADGSLSGTPENVVVPSMGILPPAKCDMNVAGFSGNPGAPGAVCEGLKFLRYNINGPAIKPSSLRYHDLIVSNSHGNTSIPYKKKRLTTEGWMGILYTEDSYKWEFDHSTQFTNISYNAETRFLYPGDYYYVEQQFMQNIDAISTTGDQRNSTDGIPDPDVDRHGDYYWNNETRTVTYMVSREEERRRTIFDDRDLGISRSINLKVYRCYYENCIKPTPPPIPTGRPDSVFRWSNNETWKEVPVGSGGHPTNETYGLPVEGDEIIIPAGMWLLVDIETPKLGRVYVYGTIEFEDEMDHVFESTIIYIQGGKVLAGASESEPFNHNLNIILRGSLNASDPDNVDMPMPEGVPNVGWKAMGVFGELVLHGQHSGSTWTRLGSTASPGATVITLSEAAHASWVDKEVMITTTSKEASETEVRTVVAVSGSTLALDVPLQYEHLGSSFSLSDSSANFMMAAEVGILTRNIRIEGNTYPDLQEDSFGGRIIVSKLTSNDIDYVGKSQLFNVELKNMGQEGFVESYDPRFSLAFVNLGVNDGSSYVKKCTFNTNYNTAIGLFDTSNVTVEDNIVYHTVGSCIIDESANNVFRRNLASTMLFPGTYNGRWEKENLAWYGAFELNKATGFVLEGNVVAGSEHCGYLTYGEMCGEDTLWQDNEVHSATYGVMLWKKGAGSAEVACRRLNNFYAWRVWDTAFYMQHYYNMLLRNVKGVDCQVGVNQIIYAPPSLSHKFMDKTATTETSTFVGASSHHTCDYHNSEATIQAFYDARLWHNGVLGGNSGIIFASFVSSANMAPKKSLHQADSYPALYGATHVKDVVFANYDNRSCGTDVALITNKDSDDAIHPIFTRGLTFIDTPSNNYLFLHKANLGRVNPSDCVDMDCDGHKKVVIRDMDGSLLGNADATAVALAESEWDGDPRRGVGDYRIPVSLKQNIDGSEIPASDKFPNKGIVRDSSCSIVPAWRAWKCSGVQHRMMIIESMDSDTEVRRLSPIALIANPGTNGYVDLINGPMDRGWCFGYTCQERISTFYSVVATNYIYEMAMTSTPPQVIRFHLLHADPSEAVLLRIYFPKTQRYDIYVNDVFVPPTNIDETAESYQLKPYVEGSEEFFPTLSDPVGSNYLQRREKFLHVLLRGGHIIDIKTVPMVILTTGVVLGFDEFFDENVVANMAAMLGVSEANIRVTNVIREDSRSRGELESAVVTFDIAGAPTATLEGGEGVTAGEILSYETLEQKLSRMIDCYQSDTCQQGGNVTITKVEIVEPVPPPKEPGDKATQEYGQVVIEGGDLYSNVQQKEEEKKLNESLKATVYEEPGGSYVEQGVPKRVVAFTPFSVQPMIAAYSREGIHLEALGHINDPWMIKAVLSGGPEKAVLLGDNPVPYLNGAANFTNLSVNYPGRGFSLRFHVAYPEMAPNLAVGLGYTFRATEKTVTFKIMSTPDYVTANANFSVQMAIIDDDTGMIINPSQLAGQTLHGKIQLTKGKKTKLSGPTKFTVENEDVADFTIDGLSINKRGVNLRYSVKAFVKPAMWKFKIRSKDFDVLPENLIIPTNKTTKRISMKGNWKLADAMIDMEKTFAKKLEKALMIKVGIAYWHDVTVTVNSHPVAVLYVSGSPVQVEEAIDKLCVIMKKKKLRLRIKKKKVTMKQLKVDGVPMKCI